MKSLDGKITPLVAMPDKSRSVVHGCQPAKSIRCAAGGQPAKSHYSFHNREIPFQ